MQLDDQKLTRFCGAFLAIGFGTVVQIGLPMIHQPELSGNAVASNVSIQHHQPFTSQREQDRRVASAEIKLQGSYEPQVMQARVATPLLRVAVAGTSSNSPLNRVPASLTAPTRTDTAELSVPSSPRNIVVAGSFDLDPVNFGRNSETSIADCTPKMSLNAQRGAMISVQISAPCSGSEEVLIVHERMAFTEKLNANGDLQRLIPAFQSNAGVAVQLEGRPPLSGMVKVADVANFHRVSIQWAGTADLELRANEKSKPTSAIELLSAGNSNRLLASETYGEMMRFGDANTSKPMRSAVYSIRASARAKFSEIEMAVLAHNSPLECGKSSVIYAMRNQRGEFSVGKGVQFFLPNCESGDDFVLLRHAIRDLEMASR
jgi:hypothetical protein